MQGSLLLKTKDVDRVLNDEALEPKTRKYLELSKKIIHFAESELEMNTGRNYRKFIDLKRPWVTQIVVAAHKDRLEPYLFKYPIVGDLPYKGYFKEADAITLQDSLKEKNLDTYRRPVEAFSTAGWLPDPLLSTMFSSTSRFIELLFHELTHSTFYFKSEADFNEAFASWMGFKGALLFVEKYRAELENADVLIAELKEDHAYQIKLARIIREVLKYSKEFYKQENAKDKREELFTWIKARFAKEPGFEKLAIRDWNNALINGLGTYYEMVEPIEAFSIKHSLSPSQFLKRVKASGPSIINEINSAR